MASRFIQCCLVLIIGYLCCINWAVYSHHQRQHFWRRTCSCHRRDHRRTILENLIVNMYRGLFLTQRGLRRLPIIKPLGERTHNHGSRSYVGNTVPQMNRQSQSCCNTDYAYEVLNTTVENHRQLRVVHFDHAYQFVPTGRCQTSKRARCGRGRCIQMYRHHWMLVWDDALHHFPPVRFVPVEIPSHCECVNIGVSVRDV